MTDRVSHSRAVLTTKARSFRWAAAFLPERCHDDAALLYAFCRAVDDAADECRTKEEGRQALQSLQRALDADDDSLARTVKERVLVDTVARDAATRLMEGAWSDLGDVRVATDRELLAYCYSVAGTVGVMMLRVLRVDDPAALPHAIDLGIAMQLTNICRDVLEDAQNGRVYLPEDRLRGAGTSQAAILNGTADRSAVAAVVCDLLALAEQFYASADAGLRFIQARPRLAILVASRLYRAIGLRLSRRGGDALAGRTVIAWWEKIAWVARAVWTWPWLSIRERYLQPHRTGLHALLQRAPEAAPR